MLASSTAITNSSMSFKDLFQQFPETKDVSIKEIFDYLKILIPNQSDIDRNLNRLKLKNYKYIGDGKKKIFGGILSSTKIDMASIFNSFKENNLIFMIIKTYFYYSSMPFGDFKLITDKLIPYLLKIEQDINEKIIEVDSSKNCDLLKIIYDSLTINDFLFVGGYSLSSSVRQYE